MNKRYVKVLGLYVASTAVPVLLNKVCKLDGLLKWTVQTGLGYGIFAYGLKVMTRRKKAAQ
ncbi:hypothetical protein MUA26_09820 [Staphylococcus sp. IVB6246]|uniref:hypothetical protein n=1 Tax=unclassified Staphylococcus TaxID=91994 RepID=UPI0021D03BAE|nr:MULTISPECIES: hypothetical protein [unclassified Staphylococcus]UXR69402.1 hypothetical protein MUA26_09820 [Staphylococcus sp. IVB6246]UXR71458.1 hypothetical protein MUA88_09845 [Staphylococcus sp. IVB6240]UXR73736.1 hypothetical protein MUA48_10345 [Staphylococcus sp. IVB6238]